MDGFTLIDGAIAIGILISAVLAYSRGILREAMSILGWFGAVIVAFFLTPHVEPLAHKIPWIPALITETCLLSMVAAFIVTFAIALIIISMFTPVFSRAIRDTPLSGLDHGFGLVFGAARGLLLVLICFIFYDSLVPVDNRQAMVENSKVRMTLSESQTKLSKILPTKIPNWLQTRYGDFVGYCSAKDVGIIDGDATEGNENDVDTSVDPST